MVAETCTLRLMHNKSEMIFQDHLLVIFDYLMFLQVFRKHMNLYWCTHSEQRKMYPKKSYFLPLNMVLAAGLAEWEETTEEDVRDLVELHLVNLVDLLELVVANLAQEKEVVNTGVDFREDLVDAKEGVVEAHIQPGLGCLIS